MKPLTKYVKAVSAKSNRLHEQCTNNLMKFVDRNFKPRNEMCALFDFD